jgi:hypothetical protein
MVKIGILLDSMHCSKYIYDSVRAIAASNQINIFFLLNSDAAEEQGVLEKAKRMIKTKSLLRFLQFVFFKFISVMEYKILSSKSEDIKEHNAIFNINEFNNNEIVDLRAIYSASGRVVRYANEDIDKIKALHLDLIIRGNASGIFKGDIINVAKDGIISFHHGDNRWNRGGPPGFWEVYFRKPSTGFIIQILSEELDGGAVIFRGNIPTQRSYTENLVHLYNTSYPCLVRLILQYAKSHTLPSPEERLPYGGALFMVPTIAQSISYLARTGLQVFSSVTTRLVFRKDERWSVAFTHTHWRDAVLRKGIQIKNPPYRFFADPFIITKDEKTICYVEDYHYSLKKGCITAIEIKDAKNYRILGPVIEEPFHMSFPFLFTYQNELYMVPEVKESHSIRLYKCVDFPLKWAYQKDILSGVNAVDPMIFESHGKWWLLCNMNWGESTGFDSTLLAFYSDNPLSDDWTAHKLNPLIFDCNIARNGGILNIEGNSPFRVRQKQGFNSYGKGLSIAKIIDLTPTTFWEEKVVEIPLDFFKGIEGCHHMHSNGNYTVYDFLKIEPLN